MRDSRTAGSVKDRSKSLMFCPNCHWKWPRFPCPNRFGSSRPRNPPTPVPCPTDAPKLMLPVCFSVTWKMTSTSPWSFAGRGAPDDVGARLHIDVAVVVVQRPHLLGGVVPFLLVEVRRPVLHAAQPQQPGARLALEGEQLLQVLGGKPAVAHDLERADAIGLALAHPHHERGLPRRVVDHQRVVEHLEVDVPPIAVEPRQPLLEVRPQLLVVVLARAEPPEALGPRLHRADQGAAGEVRIALERDAGDG